LSLVGSGLFELNLSVSVCFEYEDVLFRPGNGISLGDHQKNAILDYLCGQSKHHQIHFLWRPHLKDPGDDFFFELALKAQAQALVTFNKQDFQGLNRYGIEVLSPSEFLFKIQTLT
jgi:predicted nucleic acid-binding protein